MDENGNDFYYDESRRIEDRLDRDLEREHRRRQAIPILREPTTTTLIPKAGGVEQPPVKVGGSR